jgi:phosphoserine aminotransferase
VVVECGSQAFEEGKKFSKARLAAKGDNKSIPPPSGWDISPDAK